jgi:hypothetical protein
MATKTIDQLPSSSPLVGNEVLPIVQGNETVKTTVQEIGSFTRPYKVYTALLTQSGGDDIQGQYSGTLIIGRTYEILDVGDPAGDWTNVGAPNNELGTKFVATGTTPNSWGDGGGLSYNSGAPVVTVLENTIGNIWFTYVGDGFYELKSNGLFTLDKTFCQGTSITAEDATGFRVTVIFISNINTLSVVAANPITETVGNDRLLNTPIEIRVYN